MKVIRVIDKMTSNDLLFSALNDECLWKRPFDPQSSGDFVGSLWVVEVAEQDADDALFGQRLCDDFSK